MGKVAVVVLALVSLFAALPVGWLAESAKAQVKIAGHGGGELL